MDIRKTTIEELNINLGESYIVTNSESSTLDEYTIIYPNKNYGYYSKKLLKALNSGVISQFIYNSNTEYQGNEKSSLLLNSDIEISKEIITTLIGKHNIPNINTEGSIFEIVTALIENGYLIIKKI